MKKPKIEIGSIYPADWKKFKDLWLEALTDSPQAFGHSFKELTDRTYEEWQEKNIKKITFPNLIYFYLYGII